MIAHLPSCSCILYSHSLQTADDDDHYISCGSAIKIQQKDTGYYLNSEEKQLGGGSGQQIITFVSDPGTHNTLWHIRPAQHGLASEYPETASCQLAQPIPCGGVIRLTHVGTYRNLHSHAVESVLSRQQEVTGYGTGDGKGDGGDNWKVECAAAGAKHWKRGAAVRLKHEDTGKYLGTSANVKFDANTCGHNCPIMGHLEAFGRSAADVHTLLTTEQGIHLSK
jgi:dolichyl-phosphate-mannose--protein O-mannosyl transferase